ncbi:Uncharacterised protein [Bordetella pertussis]|nr:Uncharacterised protein [Bordetella pertussis]
MPTCMPRSNAAITKLCSLMLSWNNEPRSSLQQYGSTMAAVWILGIPSRQFRPHPPTPLTPSCMARSTSKVS